MDNAFKPLGNTGAIAAAATALTGVRAGASSSAKAVFAGQSRIVNAGSVAPRPAPRPRLLAPLL